VNSAIPVLTIDGPSGSGKGTVSRAVARALGWHFLDSGAIYRALAMTVLEKGVSLTDVKQIVSLAGAMNLEFLVDEPPKIILNGKNIIKEIGDETCGNTASIIATVSEVRESLLAKQRSFQRLPGLVADGRDMGTVVFKDARYKVYLTASAEVRALRRYKQLKEKGADVNLADLTREIEERDQRDRDRVNAPLRMADDAILVDSSQLGLEEVIRCVVSSTGLIP
jgi:cytidylate kinase